MFALFCFSSYGGSNFLPAAAIGNGAAFGGGCFIPTNGGGGNHAAAGGSPNTAGGGGQPSLAAIAAFQQQLSAPQPSASQPPIDGSFDPASAISAAAAGTLTTINFSVVFCSNHCRKRAPAMV